MQATQEKPAEGAVIVTESSYSKRGDAVPVQQRPEATSLVQALAAAAADPRTDMDKMERLFAMHQKMVQQQAEQEFNDAMARAQAKVEPIAKDRRNDHTKSWYATLSAINEAITPIYSAEGLSVSFDTYSPERDKELPALEKGWHRVVAIVSHKGGHSRRYHLDAPLDDAGAQGTKNKTGIQAMGSTVSYLRRYLVCMIFNVATADDDDGNGASGGSSGSRMDEKKLADHLAKIDEAADEPSLLKAFGAAWNAAEDVKDKSAQRLLMQHRDAKRKALREKGARR